MTDHTARPVGVKSDPGFAAWHPLPLDTSRLPVEPFDIISAATSPSPRLTGSVLRPPALGRTSYLQLVAEQNGIRVAKIIEVHREHAIWWLTGWETSQPTIVGLTGLAGLETVLSNTTSPIAGFGQVSGLEKLEPVRPPEVEVAGDRPYFFLTDAGTPYTFKNMSDSTQEELEEDGFPFYSPTENGESTVMALRRLLKREGIEHS